MCLCTFNQVFDKICKFVDPVFPAWQTNKQIRNFKTNHYRKRSKQAGQTCYATCAVYVELNPRLSSSACISRFLSYAFVLVTSWSHLISNTIQKNLKLAIVIRQKVRGQLFAVNFTENLINIAYLCDFFNYRIYWISTTFLQMKNGINNSASVTF